MPRTISRMCVTNSPEAKATASTGGGRGREAGGKRGMLHCRKDGRLERDDVERRKDRVAHVRAGQRLNRCRFGHGDRDDGDISRDRVCLEAVNVRGAVGLIRPEVDHDDPGDDARRDVDRILTLREENHVESDIAENLLLNLAPVVNRLDQQDG